MSLVSHFNLTMLFTIRVYSVDYTLCNACVKIKYRIKWWWYSQPKLVAFKTSNCTQSDKDHQADLCLSQFLKIIIFSWYINGRNFADFKYFSKYFPKYFLIYEFDYFEIHWIRIQIRIRVYLMWPFKWT